MLAGILEAIGTAPDLPGARCLGQHDMFDNHTDPDIWQACQFVCERCPALSDCEQWVTSLKPSQRPFGVTAGQLRQPRQRKDHAA